MTRSHFFDADRFQGVHLEVPLGASAGAFDDIIAICIETKFPKSLANFLRFLAGNKYIPHYLKPSSFSLITCKISLLVEW